MDKSHIFKLHSLVAHEEALKWGSFRDGKVGISGTSHQPPAPEVLDSIFSEGIEAIQSIKHPVERALIYYFWGAMNQFFYDGNKRTSRAAMNGILMSEGYYYLSVPAAKKDEFNSVMVNFYNNKDAGEAIAFFLSCYKNWD